MPRFLKNRSLPQLLWSSGWVEGQLRRLGAVTIQSHTGFPYPFLITLRLLLLFYLIQIRDSLRTPPGSIFCTSSCHHYLVALDAENLLNPPKLGFRPRKKLGRIQGVILKAGQVCLTVALSQDSPIIGTLKWGFVSPSENSKTLWK